MTRRPAILCLERDPTDADARRLRPDGRIARTTDELGRPAGTLVGRIGPGEASMAVAAVQLGWDLVVRLDLRGEERRLLLEDLGRLGDLLDESALHACPVLDPIDDDLLNHLASGATVRAASRAVGVSDRTAARRLAVLRDALGVATTAGLVARWRGER